MISAPFFDRVRGDMNPNEAVQGTDGIPTIDLGILELERVDVPVLLK